MSKAGDTIHESVSVETRSALHDEIDLFDLVDDIWKNKEWVFGAGVVAVILAIIYLSQVTSIYQSETTIKPATESDLVEFVRPQLKGVYQVDVSTAFGEAQSALLSSDYRKDFYELKLEYVQKIPGLYSESLSFDQNFTFFNALFSSKLSVESDVEQLVKLKLNLADPDMAATFLNEYVEYALFRRLRDNYDTMIANVNSRLESLNYRADSVRETYFGNKARRILELKEALAIARAVGQVSPIYRNIELMGNEAPPLYMLGAKAINAEIKALESRENMAKDLPGREDNFIEGLSEIKVDIESLESLNVDFNKIRLARIDEKASVPLSPIKPRKTLILVLSLLLGLFSGIIVALIVSAYSKHKKRLART